ILSQFLTLGFSIADMVVVGRFGLVGSVGAIGATNTMINLIIVLFLGISTGAGVATARALGEKDAQKVRDTVGTALPTAIICGAIIASVGILASRWFLTDVMKTPADLLERAITYIRIYFIGQIGSIVYLFCSAILRAAGETKIPLIFLAMSGVLNFGLNLFFVLVLKQDVAGVATSTAISNFFSAFLILRELSKRTDQIKLVFKNIGIKKERLLYILKIGVPAGINSCMFHIANVIIQRSLNGFGSEVVTGLSAAHTLETLVANSAASFMHASMNFCAQNAGAGKYDRVRKSAYLSAACAAVVGLVFGNLMYYFSPQLMRLYLKGPSEATVKAGVIRMAYNCRYYVLVGLMDSFTGALRGIGYSTTSLIISVLGVCGFRIVWNYTEFAKTPTLECLLTAYPISWALTFVASFIFFFFIVRKVEKRAFKGEL
ncbi:MAG: polysaccharide biosynthesis C-terminal domain-containing protein, partial [Clostridia bacterium]|nr:polysaccharide biosynthesis C-terminal domain-containing protein [Clostridia bacterium]